MTPEVRDLMNQVVIGLLTIVILPSIPLFWKILKAYGDAKIAQIADTRMKAAVEFAFSRLDFLVTNTVAAISQVNDKNTGLTKEEAKARRDKAFTYISAQLTDEDKAILKTAVKDFDRYLVTKIEAVRYFQKGTIK